MTASTTSQPPRAARLRRGKDGAVPAASSFDLLDGAFVKVARARLVRLLAAGAALLVIVAIGVQSLMVRLEAADLDRERAAAEEQLLELKAQVAREANTGGLTRNQMEGQLASLGRGTAMVAFNDLALRELVSEIDARTPGNVEITGMVLTPTTGANGIVLYSLTLTATAPGYDTAFAYRDSLRASPSLEGLELTWAGSEEALTLTVTANLAASLETTRSVQYRSQFADDFDPVEAARTAAEQGATAPAETDAAKGGH